MPDPIDDLFSTFQDGGTPVKPLPAAEVRRRGDRLRRRNTTLAAVGGVAAVLAVATPFAVLAQGGSDSSAPDPVAPPAQVDWIQEIPAGLDLRTGLAAGAESSDEPGVPTLTLCGETAFDAAVQTVDVAGVVSRGTPNTDEPELRRTLALYPDGDAAAGAVTGLRGALEACPAEPGPGDQTIRHEPIASELGADESFLIASSYVAADEDYAQAISYFVVARTGNAVLVTADLGTAPYEPQVGIEQERVAEVVDAMQVFAQEEGVVADPGALLPDGFPLDSGMAPSGATTAPTVFSDLSGDALAGLTPCRREAWSYRDEAILDVLGATWSDGSSGGEFRTVATYAPGDAAAALTRISDEVTSCDAITPRDVAAGDEAVAFTDPGATTYVVIRVGDALLLIQSVDADPTDLVTRAAPVLEALAAR